MKVSILTGGRDAHYALGLLSGIVLKDISIDFIGNDYMSQYDLVKNRNVTYFNLRKNQDADARFVDKAVRVIKYYVRLIAYVQKTDSEIFHILWLNKFEYFDRVILNLYYRLLGKKLLLTAHNVDKEERDGKSGVINRLTLKIMYRLMSHIFVHTNAMKLQMVNEFGVNEQKITVIPFGINNMVPRSEISDEHARKKLGLGRGDRIVLFFGNIAPYKGLEFLIEAMPVLVKKYPDIKLIIAGCVKLKEYDRYWIQLNSSIEKLGLDNYIIKEIKYIGDDEVELYFKAADLLVLPYKFIFQTGVLFLSYNFGLPVVATDVGSIQDDLVEGETGFICRAEDPHDLAEKIEKYFESSLYKELGKNRRKIIDFGNRRHSWNDIGNTIFSIYENVRQLPS